MFAIGIDCGDQRPKGHTSLDGDLLQTVSQNLSSRLTLVIWFAITIERLETRDFFTVTLL
jgi:hypothetical protein